MRSGSKIIVATLLALPFAGLAMASAKAEPQGVSEADAAALAMALDDEYKAEATYVAVINAFGEARPFINIIEAERHHASMAKAEMDRLGLSYPDTNPYLGTIAAPASLLEACREGITAERENIALYDRILPTVEDSQVQATLSRLQWASRERHLPAFSRCVDNGGKMGAGGGKGGGMGGGKGHGKGRGPGRGPGAGQY